MFKSLIIVALALLPLATPANDKLVAVPYVDPIIGTGTADGALGGNCYPGATVPFGMVQVSPDTQDAPNWDKACGYNYNDTHICGFSHNRLSGTGVGDLFDVLLMPTTQTDHRQPWSRYSHDEEKAEAGYYSVMLQDFGVRAELTAAQRTGLHRYTFPAGQQQTLYVDLNHSMPKGSWDCRVIQSQLRITSPTTLEGFRVITGWAKLRKVYFHIELSRPIATHTIYDGKRREDVATVVNGRDVKAFLTFDQSSTVVEAHVSLSSVSADNARQNMQADLKARAGHFDHYRQAAAEAWEAQLGKIRINANDEVKKIFYTALYHALIQPNTMSDVSGQYMAPDFTTRQMPQGHTYYTTFSLWDTYRAAHPLYTLIAPKQNADFCLSMLAHYDAYGYLPIWELYGQDNYCMIGNHAIPVLVDAALKGLPGVDARRVLDACVQSSVQSHPGSQWEAWEKYGYMPEDIQSQSVSVSLEQAFDDWCVAQLAKRLGDDAIYERFAKRAGQWRNSFNKNNGFFQGRKSDGQWMEPFNPLDYGANGGYPYTEGNAWQWRWYVPQDVDGLIAAMGGRKAFTARLDSFFTVSAKTEQGNHNASGFIGQYAHGNEPSHHVAYLYALAGQPRKTQERVQQIMREFYYTTPAGYAGNDDCGEMSAWYVFSAMGFYPVNPTSGEFVIGSPAVDRADILLDNGKTFTIRAERRNASDIHVSRTTLNGRTMKRPVITYDEMMEGGELVFYMNK